MNFRVAEGQRHLPLATHPHDDENPFSRLHSLFFGETQTYSEHKLERISRDWSSFVRVQHWVSFRRSIEAHASSSSSFLSEDEIIGESVETRWFCQLANRINWNVLVKVVSGSVLSCHSPGRLSFKIGSSLNLVSWKGFLKSLIGFGYQGTQNWHQVGCEAHRFNVMGSSILGGSATSSSCQGWFMLEMRNMSSWMNNGWNSSRIQGAILLHMVSISGHQNVAII